MRTGSSAMVAAIGKGDVFSKGRDFAHLDHLSTDHIALQEPAAGTKGAFAAMQKNGPVLGVRLTLLARTRHSGSGTWRTDFGGAKIRQEFGVLQKAAVCGHPISDHQIAIDVGFHASGPGGRAVDAWT